MERKQAGKRDQLGKYELLELLGQGGMGEVWKARDTQLQRHVAIKLLRAELQDDPDFAASFVREARLVASLRHPNIVQIHDFQLASNEGAYAHAYMVMDYIEGGTLASAIREMKRSGVFWSAGDIVDIFATISLALDYAHGRGMIHRDIKPANILLDQSLSASHALGVPVLTDFGIARWQGGGATVTGFVGTPLYISPEQAQSRPVDERSDLYSLGIVLYEVLTGVTPFRGENPLGIMLQHVDEQPPPPALLNPLVSPALSAVVLRSIAKNPRDRFPSATAMTIALAQAFNLPVPALLGGLKEKRESPSDYNPLQPRAGGTPVLPSFQPAFRNETEPRSSFTPTHESNRMTPIAVDVNRMTPVAQPPSVQQLPPVQDTRDRRKPATRKWVLAISLGCVALLLLGFGARLVVPHLFSSSGTPIPSVDNKDFGTILFLSNASAAKGTFNEIQVDMSNVPPPSTGQIYYAWLMQEDSEAAPLPHWSLQVKNGIIHYLYTSPLAGTNLLATSNLFLITAEDANIPPVVPSPSADKHFYYASITRAALSPPSFAVKHCPTININSGANPCR